MISILGKEIDNVMTLCGGSWGTAMTQELGRHSGFKEVIIRDRDFGVVQEMNKHHRNPHLPGIKLNERIKSYVLEFSERPPRKEDLIILGAPSFAIREVLVRFKPYHQGQIILGGAKGIEAKTLMFPHQIVEDVLGKDTRYVHVSGPAFAEDVARGNRVIQMIASEDIKLAKAIKDLIETPTFQLIPTDGIIEIEIDGALKNVIAILIGMVDGLNLGKPTRSLILSEGVGEITALRRKLGIKPETPIEISGIADLLMSIDPPGGRNYRYGINLVGGINQHHRIPIVSRWRTRRSKRKVRFLPTDLFELYNAILDDVHDVFTAPSEKAIEVISKTSHREALEGLSNVAAVYQLGEQRNLNLPIPEGLHSFLSHKEGERDPHQIVEKVLKGISQSR